MILLLVLFLIAFTAGMVAIINLLLMWEEDAGSR